VSLFEALQLGPRELVAVIGGDSRPSVARAIARAIAARGRRVVSCATADVHLVAPDPGEQILADPNPEIVYRDLIERLKYFPRVTVGLGGRGGFVTLRSDDVGRRLRAVPHHLVRAIHRNPSVPYVVVEADTAVDRPLRAPTDEDLAVPPEATIVVPVVGVAALGRPLDEDSVHRPERAARWAGVEVGRPITPRVAASVLLHPEGMTAVVPAGARIFPYLAGPAGRGEGLDLARELARRLLGDGPDTLGGVVLGSSAPEGDEGDVIEIVRRPGGGVSSQPPW
jgi:probable selenium-dependent hydroxylase accessory protein YqeC